ncbi:MAG: SCP2 sterol-binding domain-containing protein [Promethearchaeota archaeon]
MSDFLKFPNLLEKDEKDFDNSLKILANYLASTSQSGCLKITIIEGEDQKSNYIIFSKANYQITKKSEKKANLELTLKLENWWKIAQGKISPLELIVRGKMAIRGDLHFGSTVLKEIGINGSKYTICV